MRIDIKPSFFYGAAVATSAGLGLGLLLHGPWDAIDKVKAPGILFPVAQAAEPARLADDGAVSDVAEADPDPMVAWGGTVPFDSPPLVRLAAAKYDAMAAARDAAREDADSLQSADSDSLDPLSAPPQTDQSPAAAAAAR